MHIRNWLQAFVNFMVFSLWNATEERTTDSETNVFNEHEWIADHWNRLSISLWFVCKNLHPVRRSVHNPHETVFERFIGGQTNRSGNNAQAQDVSNLLTCTRAVPCQAQVLSVEFHRGHHASASACLVDIYRHTATVSFNLVTHNAHLVHVRLLA